MKHLNILYYISSHGYGHATRAGQVVRELIKDHTVHIKSMAPKWLLQQTIGCEPLLHHQQHDTGCLQFTNLDVDVDGTLKAYLEQSKKNRLSIEAELSFIHEENINAIVSDIPSFAFVMAKRASIPGIFIGNFTWKGIYNCYLKDESHPIIQELTEQYGMADHSLITPLAMDMPELNNSQNISLIARKGKNIRKKLNHDFNIPKQNKLVFFYAGNLGSEKVHSDLIKKNEGYTFISFLPLNLPPVNYIYLKKGSYPHQDIMASSNIALIKPGYGMVSEALVNSVPIIYPHREDFGEFSAFKKEFETSGAVQLINREDFAAGNWRKALSQIDKKKYKKTYSSYGAIECKEFIENIIKQS